MGDPVRAAYDCGGHRVRGPPRPHSAVRKLLRPVAEGLAAIGVDPQAVQDVVITHMHYDHAGNVPLFPKAQFHVQNAEMAYCTGRAMTPRASRRAV
ncbi:MAG: MBL fold metallo-hydrolase [Steroidobacteraceae bacterium]